MFPYCKHSLLIPPKCLGLVLRPFSLGHVDVLTALESPVVTGAMDELNPAELAVAVWVCSQSADQAVRNYTKNTAKSLRELERIGKRFGARPAEFASHRAIFFEYLGAYFMAPPRWDGKAVDPVIPWHLSVFAALQRDTNYTPDEVWNLPLPRALEIFAACAANRGDETLIPPNQQAIMDLMKSQEDDV